MDVIVLEDASTDVLLRVTDSDLILLWSEHLWTPVKNKIVLAT